MERASSADRREGRPFRNRCVTVGMSPPQLSQAEPVWPSLVIDLLASTPPLHLSSEGEWERTHFWTGRESIHKSKVGTFPLERADARVLRWIRVHVSTSTPRGASGGVSWVFGPPRERGEGGARGHNMGERRDGGCRVHLVALMPVHGFEDEEHTRLACVSASALPPPLGAPQSEEHPPLSLPLSLHTPLDPSF